MTKSTSPHCSKKGDWGWPGGGIGQYETASCSVIPEQQTLPEKGLKPTTGLKSLEGQAGTACETYGLNPANSEFTRLLSVFIVFPQGRGWGGMGKA